MEFNFLKERLERFLAIVEESYKIADEIKKSPKGLSVVLESVGKSARGRSASGGKPSPEAVAISEQTV